jgi:hypothetical protein
MQNNVRQMDAFFFLVSIAHIDASSAHLHPIPLGPVLSKSLKQPKGS